MPKTSTFRPATTPLAGTETVDLIQGGKNRRTTVALFLASAFQRANHLGSQAIATVSGLDAALDAKAAIADPTRPVLADALVTAEPGMTDGSVSDTSAVCVLGTLGTDLYLFGSQNDPTAGGPAAGTLAGVWRYRDGAWTFLGKARREVAVNGVHNYNRLETWGAVAYKGNLYIGDRHTGKLYRLDLNFDDTLYRVTIAGQVGNEDVFPGPVFSGRLPLGTFGAIGLPTDYPGLFTYDGTSVAQIFVSAAIGNQGYVNSMAVHGGYLWVHLRNAAGDYCEMWRVASNWSAALVWSGTTNHKLVAQGASLLAVEWRDPAPTTDARWVVWRGGAWAAVSGNLGMTTDNPPDIRAAWAVDERLYAASYYHGISEFSGQGASKIADAPPRLQGVKVHGDTVWLMGTNPTTLYRMPSRQPAVTATFPRAVNPSVSSVVDRATTVTSLPIANSANRGRTVLLLGDGVTTADVLYQCRRSAAGIYEWAPVSVGAAVIALPPDPVLHYRADAITGLADAAAVASWVDSSSLAAPATQATGGFQPTYRTAVVNGKPVVRFDGVDDRLQSLAGGAHIQSMTTVAVAKMSSVAAAKYLFDAGSGFASHVLYGGAGNWNMYAASAGPADGASNTAWHTFICAYAESLSRLRVDGGAGTGATLPAQSRTGITLGSASTGALACPMDLAEIASWDRSLTVDEINAVGTAMAAKYALSWTTAT